MMLERMMIVEDDLLLATDMCDIVSRLGFEVSGTADGFLSAQALAPHSDIALVDINLRDGATGPRIGQYLANEFGIAVVMVTGNPEAIETDLSKVIGMISKPASPAMIETVLTFIRDTREGRRATAPRGMRVFV
ncbi:response regulator [Rhizobium leguminosarum bv. viciae]|nr:response regulator [Rhizobium binae]NKL50419.1 response regulator [Rhizobium leguminosarum bv. viciae]QSY84963.1 response regulator [Rhizobium binae]